MLFSRLLHHVPSQCAVCRGWGLQAVCEDCTRLYAKAVPRCPRCALEVPESVRVCGSCLNDPPAFDAALAAVDYAHPWSALITQFKFRAALDLAGALADRLRHAQQSAARETPGLLLPVPLSAERLQERGYNQAWEITRRLARALRTQADPALLLRIRDTPHQLTLAPERREANVRGAFAVEPQRRAELSGRTVAVVDDVMTTGATLSEIARVLKQAGAARVEAWAIARTPKAR